MRTTLAFMALAAALSSPLPACAGDLAAPADLHVRVRTYDAAGLEPHMRARAMATAASILEAAGFTVTWIDCDTASSRVSPQDSCRTSIARTELAIRFVRLAAAGANDGIALGYALVDTEARIGSLATIYADRVDLLARRSEVPPAVLLGRTVAHELGHLLMGTNSHAAAGLMKAVWSRETLQRERPYDWIFTAADVAAMRTAMRER